MTPRYVKKMVADFRTHCMSLIDAFLANGQKDLEQYRENVFLGQQCFTYLKT